MPRRAYLFVEKANTIIVPRSGYPYTRTGLPPHKKTALRPLMCEISGQANFVFFLPLAEAQRQ